MSSSLKSRTITAVCLEHMVGECGIDRWRVLKTKLKDVGKKEKEETMRLPFPFLTAAMSAHLQ